MRNLATIQKITGVHPIEGKDRIVRCDVLGWSVVCQKSEVNEGDMIVYFEIDSVLPKREEFAFMERYKYRIKTIRLGGVPSQGLVMPLKILPNRDKPYEVGEDVTDLLGVTKYDPQAEAEAKLAGNATASKNPLMRFKLFRKIYNLFNPKRKGGFPDFISKTDENRIQTVPWMLEDKDDYVATEKVDGCSGTFALVRHRVLFWNRYEYIVCSRNLRLNTRDNSVYWKVSDKYNIDHALRNMIGNRKWIAIQGECVDAKIQGNKYKVNEPHFYAFNLIDSDHGRCGSVKAKHTLSVFGIDFVPIIDEHFTLPDTVDEMLKIAHGQSAIGDTLREGLVVRSKDGKKSFKAVDPEFLLYYKE